MIILSLGVIVVIALIALSTNVNAAANATVCCEKTISGFYCQNVPAEQCAVGAAAVPTSCDSTSYCKSGTCYDSDEGMCSSNTPQKTCNMNNGTWSDGELPQCDLGCCILGDQAAFVSLVRCKKLSAFLGLTTNYNKGIKNEVACVLSVQNQDQGACVYESEFSKACKASTRDECGSGLNGTGVKGTFYKGKLCTASELGTICGKTEQTTCLPGKDGVYFVDSCGNPANIYDVSKLKDPEYWTNIKTADESCRANSANGNANSVDCGNCNYLQGSICRSADVAKNRASYGDNICADLNCYNTQNGNNYKHGESWCVYTDKGKTGVSDNAVGSRFYKHICINGEEVLEQCADFRQEECISDTIETTDGKFSQAACRVNRWQDCTSQTEQLDCENGDRRDCVWTPGVSIKDPVGKEGVCLPKNSPGLKFWEGEEAPQICAQANSKCIVTYEQGFFGKPKCVGNCECLTQTWIDAKLQICRALGDCGNKINWLGDLGYKTSYNVTFGDLAKIATGSTGTGGSSKPDAVSTINSVNQLAQTAGQLTGGAK